MFLQYLFLCIILVLFVFFARDNWGGFEEFMAWVGFFGVPIVLGVLFYMNITIKLTITIRVIQCVAVAICTILIIFYIVEWEAEVFTFWAAAWLGFFVFISGLMFLYEFGVSEEVPKEIEATSKISWDYSNPQIVTTEYMIVGTSDETIIVNVSYNGENTLSSIPFEEITVKYDDSCLKPYVYRENSIYTEYDYSEEPPKVLRQDSSTWSKYILCGTKQQIQGLFGYEETFDFEQ